MPTINQLIRIKTTRYFIGNKTNVRALERCPQRKGICVKIRIVKPKKPNSAQRKIVKVKIGRKNYILAYIPGQGHTSKNFFTVMVSGGRANDLPGVRFSLMRGKCDFSWRESFCRKHKLSKYGIAKILVMDNPMDLFKDSDLV